MLEDEDEREEVDESSHPERPLPRYSSALRRLRQSCGQLPRLLKQSFSLGGALSHTSTRCASPASTTAVTLAVVVVVTPTIFA